MLYYHNRCSHCVRLHILKDGIQKWLQSPHDHQQAYAIAAMFGARIRYGTAKWVILEKRRRKRG